MGVTNAISSVIVVGAMLATGLGDSIAAKVFGFLAVTARQREHLRRLHRHATHAVDVQTAHRDQEVGEPGMTPSLTALAYLVAAVLFILALRGLSNPTTSRQGNAFGMAGMAIAVLATLLRSGMSGSGYVLIFAGIIIGGAHRRHRGRAASR